MILINDFLCSMISVNSSLKWTFLFLHMSRWDSRASPISMWNDWQGIQGFDSKILMYTNSPPLWACRAEIMGHHCEHKAAMQCLLNQQSLCYQIYHFVQNSWNIYSIYFSVAGASLKYSCKLVFRKLQLEYNGTHLETYTSNSVPLMYSQMCDYIPRNIILFF